ncbi:MAG TPA: membrane-bound O-acyltransferase family protein, partial [Rhodospirillaceae bacterium]|nr:membrane-bound O-acyltransferase family protein [Rhodospirillaceae bacterium]
YPKCIPEADGVETAPLSPIVWKWTGGACVVGGIAAFVLAKLPDPGVFLYFNF